MVKIPSPKENPYELAFMLNSTTVPRERRSRRIGMASMSNPCLRAMWFNFRWARESNLPTRVLRIFEMGHASEKIIIDALAKAGVVITRQQEFVEGWGGHIAGFIDGVATNVPGAEKTEHLFEAKSMNDRIYKTVVKHGLKKAKFEHYVQMTMYMGKLGLKRGLYVAINKNDSEMYTERVRYNEGDYKEYMSRGMDVICHEGAPPNLFQNPKSQACIWCDFKPICYEAEPILKSCRSCVKIDIEDEGKWSCSLLNEERTFEDQHNPCPHYQPVNTK
jgi:hypothetical protein